MSGYDAILVLGGGVREDAVIPPWAAARFDLALQHHSGEPIVCLSAATMHLPPPLEDGFPILESAAGARYLMSKGIPARSIRIENASYDTIGNAYLAKLLHVDPAGWKRLLVITSEFHMARSRAVFKWVFGFEPGYDLKFLSSPDVGIPPQDLQFRREMEAKGLARLERTKRSVQSLRELHEWFWTGHDAYSAEGASKARPAPDPRLAGTY